MDIEARVLAKSVLTAANRLGLSDSELPQLLGVDRDALYQGISPYGTTGRRARTVVAIYLALHQLMGGDLLSIRHWMRSQNQDLGEIPLRLIETSRGLDRVSTYLEVLCNRQGIEYRLEAVSQAIPAELDL